MVNGERGWMFGGYLVHTVKLDAALWINISRPRPDELLTLLFIFILMWDLRGGFFQTANQIQQRSHFYGTSLSHFLQESIISKNVKHAAAPVPAQLIQIQLNHPRTQKKSRLEDMFERM